MIRAIFTDYILHTFPKKLFAEPANYFQQASSYARSKFWRRYFSEVYKFTGEAAEKSTILI